MLLSWHEAEGLPEDWSDVPEWAALPALPDHVHHVRAVHEGVTIGVHLAVQRRPGHVHTVWCAVAPAWRGRQVAQRLIARHLQWATTTGGVGVRAHTPARCQAMLVANLKAGFEIAGSFSNPDGEVVVLLRAPA